MSSYHLSTLLLFSLSCHQARYQRPVLPCQQNISTIPLLSKYPSLPGLPLCQEQKANNPLFYPSHLDLQFTVFYPTPNKCQYPITEKRTLPSFCGSRDVSNRPSRARVPVRVESRRQKRERHSVTIYLIRHLRAQREDPRARDGSVPRAVCANGKKMRCARGNLGEKCRGQVRPVRGDRVNGDLLDLARRPSSLQLPE